MSGSKEVRLGSILPTRDLNYVQDICRGFLSLGRCDEAVGREINIGSGQEISIGDLAKLLISIINPEAKIISEDLRKRPEKSEVERLICDNSLMHRLTGWKPEISLNDGLIKTLEWFKKTENCNKYKWDIYNV